MKWLTTILLHNRQASSSHHQIVIWVCFWFWCLIVKLNKKHQQLVRRQCCLLHNSDDKSQHDDRFSDAKRSFSHHEADLYWIIGQGLRRIPTNNKQYVTTEQISKVMGYKADRTNTQLWQTWYLSTWSVAALENGIEPEKMHFSLICVYMCCF